MGFADWHRLSVHAVVTNAAGEVLVHLSGVYAHSAVRSHAVIFRCALPDGAEITLSFEHSGYAYFPVQGFPPVQRQRVLECLGFSGEVRSARF